MSPVKPRPLKEVFKQVREARGISQEQLAKKAGVKKSVIAYIETGRTMRPGFERLNPLLDALEVTDEERSEVFDAAGYSAAVDVMGAAPAAISGLRLPDGLSDEQVARIQGYIDRIAEERG